MTSKNKLVACFKALGIDPHMETFSDRKIMQKLVYLLQRFGVNLKFGYSWYLHGPYSPDLTRLLFEIVAKTALPENLDHTELAKIQKLKSFLGDELRSSDKLELIVSIDYLKRYARKIGASERQILDVLKQQKPYFTGQDIGESWRKAEELDEIAR